MKKFYCHPRMFLSGISLLTALLFSACSNNDNPLSSPGTPLPNNGTLIYSSPDSLTNNAQLLFDSLNLSNSDSLIVTYRFRITTSGVDTVKKFGIVEYTGIYAMEYPMPFQNSVNYVDYRHVMNGRKKYNRLFIYVSPSSSYRIRDFKMYKK